MTVLAVALDTGVRYLGWVLEVVGISLTALGIYMTRKAFAPERPPAVETVQRVLGGWMELALVRLHLRKPRSRTVAVGNSLTVRFGAEAGTVKTTFAPVPEGASPEERLTALEHQVRHLEDRHNTLASNLGEEQRKRGEELAAITRSSSNRTRRATTAVGRSTSTPKRWPC